jgi:hypothetical protein
MSEDLRNKILGKVKKCLELAKSSNEHEAATAIRQAQKLMQEHGISNFDIANADIQEEGAKAGASSSPARWECGLANRVADAFDCEVILVCNYPVGSWVFVGAAPSGEIASYAFAVLFRQIKNARQHYMRTALKRCTTTRTRRADLFCEGWVITATTQLRHFSGSDEAKARATAYLQNKHSDLKEVRGRDRNAGRNLSVREEGDKWAGIHAGNKAEINRGIASESPRKALGVSHE